MHVIDSLREVPYSLIMFIHSHPASPPPHRRYILLPFSYLRSPSLTRVPLARLALSPLYDDFTAACRGLHSPRNWFSPANLADLYNMYIRLDRDCDGLLTLEYVLTPLRFLFDVIYFVDSTVMWAARPLITRLQSLLSSSSSHSVPPNTASWRRSTTAQSRGPCCAR